MDIPFFFSDELNQQSTSIFLDEPASRHAVQVLRMKEGEPMKIANGKGIIAVAIISMPTRKGQKLI